MRSTVFRIALGYMLGFALATLLLGTAVYLVAHRAIAQQFDDRIATEMGSLRREFAVSGEPRLLAIMRSREGDPATSDLIYALYSADGRRLAGLLPVLRPHPGWQTLTYADPSEGEDSARALAIDVAPGRRLVVAADWDGLRELDRLILTLLGVTLLAMVALGSAGALLLTAYLRRRLFVIASGAEGIIAGDLLRRIPVGPRGDEFDRLAGVLNTMLDRISGLLENLRQVSSDVAHDLRHPLTRLRNLLERGLNGAAPRRTMEDAIEQTDQLLSLFASILRLSEIEAGELRRGFGPVALDEVAAEMGESFVPAFEDEGRCLRLRVAPLPPIQGHRELLAQAVINLLENAQVHTPQGTLVQLTTEMLPDRLRLCVADDGPGVEEADRERISGRFVRLETSRHVRGHGLGLSLVAAIARVHGGTLRFDDNRPGLIAVLEFPWPAGDAVADS